jgi:hypothetical protein
MRQFLVISCHRHRFASSARRGPNSSVKAMASKATFGDRDPDHAGDAALAERAALSGTAGVRDKKTGSATWATGMMVSRV